MSRPTVAYWDFRGLGQPIRSLLAYAGVDFEDKRYSKGADGKGTEWLNEKFTLGFDFPNLPYLIDGHVKLTQTLAILRYLARKYKLDGTTETEKNRIAVLEQQVSDLNQAFFRVLFGGDESAKAEFLKNLPDSLKAVSVFLGTNHFAVGNAITYVDFWLYEYLIKIKYYAPQVFKQFKNLDDFLTRIESQPKLAAWLKKKGPQKFVPLPSFPFEH